MASEQDIENLIKMLDAKAEEGVSRINVHVSDSVEEGKTEEVRHHGRCDVGSAWAKGDVENMDCIDIPELEDEDDQ